MTAFLKLLKAEPKSPPIFLNLLVPKIRIMIASMIKQGYKVGIVDLAEGEMGSRGTIQSRYEEAKVASEILGLHYRNREVKPKFLIPIATSINCFFNGCISFTISKPKDLIIATYLLLLENNLFKTSVVWIKTVLSNILLFSKFFKTNNWKKFGIFVRKKFLARFGGPQTTNHPKRCLGGVFWGQNRFWEIPAKSAPEPPLPEAPPLGQPGGSTCSRGTRPGIST